MRLASRLTSERFLLIYCGGVAGMLLLGVVFTFLSLIGSGDAGLKQNDFIAFYTGGHFVASGHASDIYSIPAVGRFERHLVYPLTVRWGALPWIYPPFLGILLAPLGALPYTFAWWTWFAINFALLLWSIRWLVSLLRLSQGRKVVFWLITLSFLPAFIALVQAQLSIVLLACFTGAIVSLERDRRVLAGALLACTLIKPQYCLPLLLVLALRREWRTLAGFALTAAAFTGIPVLLFGPGMIRGYLAILRAAQGWHTRYGYGPRTNYGLAGFMQLLLARHTATMAANALIVLSLAALVWLVYRRVQADAALALAMLVGILASPHVLVHDLILVLIPVTLALRTRSADMSGLPGILTFGYVAIFAGLRTVSIVPLQLSAVAMAALAVWCYVSGYGEVAGLRARRIAAIATFP
jgi:hypothetical protein